MEGPAPEMAQLSAVAPRYQVSNLSPWAHVIPVHLSGFLLMLLHLSTAVPSSHNVLCFPPLAGLPSHPPPLSVTMQSAGQTAVRDTGQGDRRTSLLPICGTVECLEGCGFCMWDGTKVVEIQWVWRWGLLCEMGRTVRAHVCFPHKQ
jgi:hypothetical protein